MKKIFAGFCFIILGTTTTGLAQQNFFNVISSEITPAKRTFFQQQLNFTAQDVQSNTTFSTGLGKNFEIGFNYFGFTLNRNGRPIIEKETDKAPYNDFLMLNVQKRWDINPKMALAVGFQQGITTSRQVHSGGNYYSNYCFTDTLNGLKCVAGIYYATTSFFGPGHRLAGHDIAGIQLGVEKSIIKEKWYFQSDFISGEHSFGDLIIGTAYYVFPATALSAGYQIPTFKSQSRPALIFELTLLPHTHTKHHKHIG
ncbi:MAG: hypothetical protein WC716_07820 [Chitinophagaceae bacterium]|jgi:hypothetical protein